MKKLMSVLPLITLSAFLYAAEPLPLTLDKVNFQASARQWVTTETALLTVTINATLTNADLVKARANIMGSLAKIAGGDWHLTQFVRSQDNSGLEKLFVEAQARVSQGSLTNIYQNAKSVSKPGEAYTISQIDFKPSLEEVQAVRSQLRNKLYQAVNEELARINKVYGNQHYSVSQLNFFEGEQIQPAAYEQHTAKMMMAAQAPALTVSNEVIMNVAVEMASNRQEGGAVANN